MYKYRSIRQCFQWWGCGRRLMSDLTDMKPELHERKWEIDSLCYPLRLTYQYWKKPVMQASLIMNGYRLSPTYWQLSRNNSAKREWVPINSNAKTERALDTLNNNGPGCSCKSCRTHCFSSLPSVWRCKQLYSSSYRLISFAVSSLKKAAEILNVVNKKHQSGEETMHRFGNKKWKPH